MYTFYTLFLGGEERMIQLLIEQRFYVTAVLLFSIGFVTLFLHPNLIKKIIGST